VISIKNIFAESEFRITIFNNCLNVLNYKKIVFLSDSKIIINYLNKSLVIYGDNLTLLKLLDNELLVGGSVKSIEFR